MLTFIILSKIINVIHLCWAKTAYNNCYLCFQIPNDTMENEQMGRFRLLSSCRTNKFIGLKVLLPDEQGWPRRSFASQ